MLDPVKLAMLTLATGLAGQPSSPPQPGHSAEQVFDLTGARHDMGAVRLAVGRPATLRFSDASGADCKPTPFNYRTDVFSIAPGAKNTLRLTATAAPQKEDTLILSFKGMSDRFQIKISPEAATEASDLHFIVPVCTVRGDQPAQIKVKS